MSRTKGATNGKNKSRDEYLCYVVTKVDRFGAAIPNTSQTVYVPSTKELSAELYRISGFANRPPVKTVLLDNGDFAYERDAMGNVVLNKQKKNREGTLEWDNLGKVNSKGQKPKIIGIYYRDDVLEYQLIAENVDLCCEYEVDMVGRMS